MPKYRIERNSTTVFTHIPPPGMRGGDKKAATKKGKTKMPPQRGGKMPEMTAAPDFRTTTMAAPPGEVATASLPWSQVMRLYEYVMKRKAGQTPEEAANQSSSAPQLPPSGGPLVPQSGPQQTGSGSGMRVDQADDDCGGVALTTNEMIRVPQGDRYKVFSHPCQLLIAGATKSGKTTLLMKILQNRQVMLDPVPEEIYWFYMMDSSIAAVPDTLPDVKLKKGVPSDETIRQIMKAGRPKMIILDDMQDITMDRAQMKMLDDVLTKVSHHGNLSIVFIVQNLFPPNMNRIRAQCDEIIIMGNGTPAMFNASHLGRSLLASNGAPFLKECLLKARQLSPHSHLLISSGANAGLFSVRCGILPGDKSQAFFLQKGTITTPEYTKLKRHGEEGERREEEEKHRGEGEEASQ